VTAVAVIAAAYGVHLTYTGLGLGWQGFGVGPRRHLRVARSLPVSREAVVAVACVGAISGAVAYTAFGGVLPSVAATVFGATFPIASARRRRAARLDAAQEAWPRLLEELRVRTGALGRSIPQALFEVGRHAPSELRLAFDAAHREWMISTDFERTVVVLKEGLADPTGDAVGETLLVAHQVGGSDLDRRLAAFVADRTQEVQGRKDAAAKQAGVRFARRFVLLVPAGMAMAGMSVGNGRAAYTTAVGQVAVVTGIALVAVCWLWAGRMLQLPVQERVFGD
jgi:tight adherence protein B